MLSERTEFEEIIVECRGEQRIYFLLFSKKFIFILLIQKFFEILLAIELFHSNKKFDQFN